MSGIEPAHGDFLDVSYVCQDKILSIRVIVEFCII